MDKNKADKIKRICRIVIPVMIAFSILFIILGLTIDGFYVPAAVFFAVFAAIGLAGGVVLVCFSLSDKKDKTE
ncbi:MAG: hypothetical protein FWD58_06920 [Firmicutes bacterium]|nr:hypothetical protein [Bacillota bacterium]